MRLIAYHKLNGLNDAINVTTNDEPGPGGANHVYQLDLVSPPPMDKPSANVSILFQKGPIGEAGFNGFTNEALLAVLIDRMRGFQYSRNLDGTFNFNSRGKFASRENARALTYMEESLMWLQKRTRDRMARGVEGTHTP